VQASEDKFKAMKEIRARIADRQLQTKIAEIEVRVRRLEERERERGSGWRGWFWKS
jgi:hypothetical protein